MTDNGNLVLADVPRVADLLGVAAPAKPPQSMLDVPAVAFAFRWAVAAGFLVRVNDRVVPGDGATLLTSDPAGACLAALRGLTMVPTLLIPAGRWRALPQDFAPRMLPALLAALYEFGEMPPAELEQLGWHRCTHIYDTASLSDPANEFHRTCVAHDVRHLSRRLALLGIVELDGDVDGDVASHLDSRTIRLTPAGTWALQQLLPEHGYRLPLTGGFDLPFRVLLDRFRDLPTEAVRSELAGWAEHHGADPAEELVRVLTQGSPGERAVASYALDALSEQAEPVVRRLLDDPSARPRALSWLTARGLADPPRLTPTAAPDSVVDALAATLVAGDEDGLRDVWLALPDPGSRAALAERLAQASSPHTADVLEGLVGCDPDRRVVKAARRALFKVRCR